MFGKGLERRPSASCLGISEMRLTAAVAVNLAVKARFEQLRKLDYIWCQISDVFLTLKTNKVDIYNLQMLVKQFNLTGDLLGS